MSIIGQARTWAAALNARKLDARHNTEANVAYRTLIESGYGTAIGSNTERRIADYAREVLGSARFAPWLRVYTACRGAFYDGWIPNNYFARVVLPKVQSARNKRVTGAKTLAARTIGTDRFPDLAVCVRGAWLDATGAPLASDTVTETVFADTDTVFIKRDRASRGRGVKRVARSEFDPDALAQSGDLVVQTPLRQAPEFDKFVQGATTTLRITTTKGFGAPARATSGFLRFGRSGETSIAADSEIDVPVIDAAGTLSDVGFVDDWTPTRTHPDTATPFAGAEIPNYRAALALCASLHDRVPHLSLIGWDVVIDAAHEIWLLEINTGHAEITLPEATVGPCFRDMGWETLWRR